MTEKSRLYADIPEDLDSKVRAIIKKEIGDSKGAIKIFMSKVFRKLVEDYEKGVKYGF